MTVQPDLPLRTLLFVPGNRSDMLQKACGLAPDAIAPDLEDAVPPGEKQAARAIVGEKLAALHATGRPIIPRVNSLGTGLLEDDIAALAGPHISALSVGKIRSPEEIRLIDAAITQAEKAAGVTAGRIGVLPWIETAAGIANALQIANASARIRWIAFGADDFTADMGITRPDTGGPEPGLLYPRSALAIAARAAGVQALDTPYVAYRDHDGLLAEAALARSLGFTGKCAIHPDQIAHIESVFAPSSREIEYARRVLAAWDQATSIGSGATSLDGKLIDTPVVARARRLLDSLPHGKTR